MKNNLKKILLAIFTFVFMTGMVSAETINDSLKVANPIETMDADTEVSLAFDKENSWSIKYNLVWDKMWGSQLFSPEVYEKEIAYYLKQRMEYGIPLDSRAYFAKSDWILWCAAMAENKEEIEQFIEPVAHYVKNSVSRVPFGDWYYANDGIYCMFMARTVQGGIFMPMLFKER